MMPHPMPFSIAFHNLLQLAEIWTVVKVSVTTTHPFSAHLCASVCLQSFHLRLFALSCASEVRTHFVYQRLSARKCQFPAIYCTVVGACWPGLLEWHSIPLLVSILFLPVSFSMPLLDRGHHPYISTGFGRKHFYSQNASFLWIWYTSPERVQAKHILLILVTAGKYPVF